MTTLSFNLKKDAAQSNKTLPGRQKFYSFAATVESSLLQIPESKMKNLRRLMTFAIGILLGGIFLWLAIRNVQLAGLRSSLKAANLWVAFPFLAILALFYWLKAVRWSLLIKPTRPIPASQLLPALMIGLAGNNLLPVRLGEIIRIYSLGYEQNLSKSTILGTLILERVFDVLSILLLISVALYATNWQIPEFQAAKSFILVAAGVSVFITYAVTAAPPYLIRIIVPLLDLLPKRLRHGAKRKLSFLRQGFAALTDSSALVLLHIFLNSLAQWTLIACSIYLSIVAFETDVVPLAAVLILGLVVAGISLPSAPGFVGTIEYCFVLGLGFFDVDATRALSIGVFYHAISFLTVVAAGTFFMRRYRTSLSKLVREASQIKNLEE